MATAIIASLIFCSQTCSNVSAQESEDTVIAPTDEGVERPRERQSRTDRRGARHLIEQFDDDGSRGLDVFELAAAIRQRREERRHEQSESNEGEQRTASTERPPSPRDIAERLLEEFDRNGDGELNGLEVARMLEELRRRAERQRRENREEREETGESEESERPRRERERPTARGERENPVPIEAGNGSEGEANPYPLPRPF